jgi:hypothetical protein
VCFDCVQRSAADSILRDLQNNPDMWLQVMHILQNTQNLNTKFFALQVRLLFTEQLLDFWIYGYLQNITASIIVYKPISMHSQCR